MSLIAVAIVAGGAGTAAAYKLFFSSQTQEPTPSKAELKDQYDKVNCQNWLHRGSICIIFSLLLAIFMMAMLAPQYFPAWLFTTPWWKVVPLLLLSVSLLVFAVSYSCYKIVRYGHESKELRNKLNAQSSGGGIYSFFGIVNNIHINNNFCSSTCNFTASFVGVVMAIIFVVLMVRYYREH